MPRIGANSLVIAALLVIASSAIFAGLQNTARYTGQAAKSEVLVLYAGSLVKTFETSLGPAFQRETGFHYLGEGRGALQLSNMILDGQRRPDVFVSAGSIAMERLLHSNPPMARWHVRFALGEIVIAYSPTSPFFSELERARRGELPWYVVLSRPGLRFMRTDPELDPKGYFTIVAFKLASLHYKDPNLVRRILGEARNPHQLLPEEILKSALESGQIDAASAYSHEAVARGLPFISLPAEVNLGDPSLSSNYKKASYVTGSGEEVRGEPISFYVTIPQTARNSEGALAFLRFLLSRSVGELLERDGLKPIAPVAEGEVDKMPSLVRALVGGQ